MTPILRTALFAACAIGAAFPAAADEPGPGGTKPLLPTNGEQVYKMVCQSCHMPDAKGAVGAGTFPALASNTNLQVPEYAIMMISNGRGAMPAFRGQLSPKLIAEASTYIRTHFGNKYKKVVTTEQVAAIVGQ